MPGEIIADPACWYRRLSSCPLYTYVAGHYKLDKDEKRHLRYDALRGSGTGRGLARLAAMNLFLHGYRAGRRKQEARRLRQDDALRSEPSEHVDVVLTNPPFGKKSSITVINEEGRHRQGDSSLQPADFWTTTSNKQLNFLQQWKSMLKVPGRAAVVVPDNVLFEGGAGEKIRRKLVCKSAKFTRSCVYPRASSMRKACEGERYLLRPKTRCKGTVDPKRFGSTTAAPTRSSR